MSFIVKITDPKTGETNQSPRRFPSRDAAETWASKMVRFADWKVEPDLPQSPAARGLD